jgi:hypothetical protein
MSRDVAVRSKGKPDRNEPDARKWWVYIQWITGVRTAELAAQLKVNQRTIQRWIDQVKMQLEAVPEFDRAQDYMEDMVKPAMQVYRMHLAKGNWRVATKILERFGLAGQVQDRGDSMYRKTDIELLVEVLTLVQQSGDSRALGEVRRLLVKSSTTSEARTPAKHSRAKKKKT